jgi:hypothetical protein
MLFAHVLRGTSLVRIEVKEGDPCPADAVWIDLVAPTPGEDKLVESAIGVMVPTREEMAEIEISSRLYIENGARYMTATLLFNTETEKPGTTAITFIVAGNRLVTVRYDEPKPFSYLAGKLSKACAANTTGPSIMVELLDAILDVLAAVDVNLGAVHIRTRLRAQHVDDLRDFVGRAEPVHRNLLVHDLLGARREDRRVDLARRDGIDAHADADRSRTPSHASALPVPLSTSHRLRLRRDARASPRSR